MFEDVWPVDALAVEPSAQLLVAFELASRYGYAAACQVVDVERILLGQLVVAPDPVQHGRGIQLQGMELPFHGQDGERQIVQPVAHHRLAHRVGQLVEGD